MLFSIRKVNRNSLKLKHFKKIVMKLNTFRMCHLINLYNLPSSEIIFKAIHDVAVKNTLNSLPIVRITIL